MFRMQQYRRLRITANVVVDYNYKYLLNGIHFVPIRHVSIHEKSIKDKQEDHEYYFLNKSQIKAMGLLDDQTTRELTVSWLH
jgi:hypothetical protein